MEMVLREDTEHLTVIEFPSVQADIIATCSCGARWTHPYGTGRETIKSIYTSHVAYAKRMTTRVD